MDFATHDDIELRYFTDDWGPYFFNFANSIPASDTIASVDVKAYQGKVKPKDDLAAETEVTTSVVDSDQAPSVSESTKIRVEFKYTAAQKGLKATLIFELTMTSGAKHPFYFHVVKTV